MNTETTTLRAYHNDPALRIATLAQMQAHHDADQIVQGQYFDDGRGCAVGCLTHDPHGGHELYPVRWGIPRGLAHLEDKIFEGLPVKDAREWPVAFLSAIPLGADLSLAIPRFLLALLVDPARGVVLKTKEGTPQRAAVERVAALLARTVGGEIVTLAEWRKARAAAAYDAAYAAAYDAAAAAYDAADAAAYAAAYDAAAAAYDAADAAAYAAAYDAAAAAYDAADAYDAYARRGHYRWMADTLLEVLRTCPVPA